MLSTDEQNVINETRDIRYTLIRRIIGTVVSCVLLFGSLALLFQSFDPNSTVFKATKIFLAPIFGSQNVSTQVAPLLLTIFNLFLPTVFSKISAYEQWSSPEFEINVTLLRYFLLKIGGLVLLFVNIDSNDCWQKMNGQRLYQLLWTDTFVTAIGTVMHAFLSKKLFKEHFFDLKVSILEIVYRQGIIWSCFSHCRIGTMYSPIIIVVGVLNSFVLFYVHLWTVQKIASPPKKMYSSVSHGTFFMMLMLLTLIIVLIPWVFYGT